MKKYFLMLLIPFSFAYCQQIDHKTEAETILAQMQKREFAKITARFDSSIATRIDTARLRQTWDKLLQITGPFDNLIKISSEKQDSNDVVIQHLQFEKRKIDFKLVWGPNNKIKIITFLPGEPREKYKQPDYDKPELYKERKLPIQNGPYHLPGLLTTPNKNGKFPVVIFIHGSGPNDKDETVGPMKIFKDFSIGLASQGISTYRYDKRTRVYSIRMQLNKNLTVVDETIEDAVAAVNMLKSDSTVDSTAIYLCGHSMGAFMLPRIAEAARGVKGLIYLCVNARPLEDLIYAQSEYILSFDTSGNDNRPILDSIRNESARIKTLKEPDTDSTYIFRFPRSYWIDMNKYDPIKTAQRLKMPMFFIHGERDYQVYVSDFNTWKDAMKNHSNAQFKLYPDLNHFFIKGTGKSTIAEYNKSSNVDIAVINDIAAWVSAAGKK